MIQHGIGCLAAIDAEGPSLATDMITAGMPDDLWQPVDVIKFPVPIQPDRSTRITLPSPSGSRRDQPCVVSVGVFFHMVAKEFPSLPHLEHHRALTEFIHPERVEARVGKDMPHRTGCKLQAFPKCGTDLLSDDSGTVP